MLFCWFVSIPWQHNNGYWLCCTWEDMQSELLPSCCPSWLCEFWFWEASLWFIHSKLCIFLRNIWSVIQYLVKHFFFNWVFGDSSLYDLMSTDGLLRSLGFILGMKWGMPSDLKTEPQKGLILSNAFTFDYMRITSIILVIWVLLSVSVPYYGFVNCSDI